MSFQIEVRRALGWSVWWLGLWHRSSFTTGQCAATWDLNAGQRCGEQGLQRLLLTLFTLFSLTLIPLISFNYLYAFLFFLPPVQKPSGQPWRCKWWSARASPTSVARPHCGDTFGRAAPKSIRSWKRKRRGWRRSNWSAAKGPSRLKLPEKHKRCARASRDPPSRQSPSRALQRPRPDRQGWTPDVQHIFF